MGRLSDAYIETPYQRHSETSKEAAQLAVGRISALQAWILDYLRANPYGATDEQMQISLAMQPNTQRPRRRELELAGKVKDSGRTALTQSGRKAVLWVLA